MRTTDLTIVKKSLLFIFVLFTFSCTSELREKPINSYFDVDSLLNSQLAVLGNREISVKKTISIDGQSELDTVSFDSLGWKNELAVFRIADINKPNLKGKYQAVEERSEDQIIWKYTTEESSLGIENLKVFFDKEKNITKLTAVYNEINSLYTSKRNLSMLFDDKKQLLSSYSVDGSQKMIMKEPVVFEINSEILF